MNQRREPPPATPGRRAPVRRGVSPRLVARLRRGDLRTKGAAEAVARQAAADPALIAELVAALENGHPGVRMRAADALEKATRKQPARLRPWSDRLLELAATAGQQEVQWHLAQLLPRLRLSAADRRRGWWLLRSWLSSPSRIVQAFALEGLVRLCDGAPALLGATRDLVRQAQSAPAPALRARARRLQRALDRSGGFAGQAGVS
jgi:hypothetical protein